MDNQADDKRELSPAEWNVMESLWRESPKIGSRIVQDLKEKTGWSRSTTLTMLRRMTDKGLVACQDGEGARKYFPLLDRESAVRRESESFLRRVYNGSVSSMLLSFVEKQRLSGEEIEELYEILKKAEGREEQ